MTRMVEVRTPARLHFGLSSFGGTGRQFSGLGLMVDGAGIVLRGSLAKEFVATGPHADRAEAFARTWADHQQLPVLPAARLEVVSAPPDHIGLGIGTQLGLAVVAALSELFNVEYRDAATLAQMSGRGRRSAIGTHGFLHGGLLVDAGKLPDDPLGTLQTRFEMPTPWRFVLIREPAGQGLAGKAEQTAISSLPPVASEVTESLHTLISAEILPAIETEDFSSFSDALYRYGYQAGECFAAAQGGPFASPAIANLVEHVRSLGYPGAGQSSWGPTVFVATNTPQSAEALVAQLQEHPTYQHHHFTITSANNTGAIIQSHPLA